MHKTALLAGAIGGGLAVAIATNAIPKMMSQMMPLMMHNMMPKMMNSCFAKMDTAQRHDMLRMCRETLDQIEAKYTSHKA